MQDRDLQADGGHEVGHARTRIRWELILLLFASGAALCLAAFLLDGNGWKGLGPSALLEIGVSVGLVGVLLIVERSLIAEIRKNQPIVKCYVRRRGQGTREWDTWAVARPEDILEFLIRFENPTDRAFRNVAVGNNLPKYLSYVEGSTELRCGAFPSGTSIESDNVIDGGIDVGHYEPGAVGYVMFSARVDPASAFERSGTHDVRNVGVVRPGDLAEQHNVSKVLLDVQS